MKFHPDTRRLRPNGSRRWGLIVLALFILLLMLAGLEPDAGEHECMTDAECMAHCRTPDCDGGP